MNKIKLAKIKSLTSLHIIKSGERFGFCLSDSFSHAFFERNRLFIFAQSFPLHWHLQVYMVLLARHNVLLSKSFKKDDHCSHSDHLVLKWMLFRNIKVKSDDGSHLELPDALGPGKRIIMIKCTQALTVKQ